MIYYWSLITIIYLLYIQFSSTMGNMWIRNNRFVPYNALRLMAYPLYDYKMWIYTDMLAINYFAWIIVAYILYKYLCTINGNVR